MFYKQTYSMHDSNSLGCPHRHHIRILDAVSCYLSLMPEMNEFLTAQPLHWVYDLQKLRGFLDENPNPEFRPKPENPFYRRQTGKQSCYGDQAFVLLESLSECGGTLFVWTKPNIFQREALSESLWCKNSNNFLVVRCPLFYCYTCVMHVTLWDGLKTG